MRIAVRCQLVCFTCGKVVADGWSYTGKAPVRNLLAAAKANGAKLDGHEVFCSTDCLTDATLKYGEKP